MNHHLAYNLQRGSALCTCSGSRCGPFKWEGLAVANIISERLGLIRHSEVLYLMDLSVPQVRTAFNLQFPFYDSFFDLRDM